MPPTSRTRAATSSNPAKKAAAATETTRRVPVKRNGTARSQPSDDDAVSGSVLSGAAIEITAEPASVISVDLVGIRYELTPPKAALALKMAQRARLAGEDPDGLLEALGDWMKVAFGPPVARKVQARLDSPDDLLDIDHVAELMNKVLEYTTGNPTT